MDLIRAASHQHERLEQVRGPKLEAVGSVASTPPAQNGLDGDTQNALLRFARFIHKEKKEKEREKEKPSSPAAKAAVSKRKLAGYQATIDLEKRFEMIGQVINLTS